MFRLLREAAEQAKGVRTAEGWQDTWTRFLLGWGLHPKFTFYFCFAFVIVPKAVR